MITKWMAKAIDETLMTDQYIHQHACDEMYVAPTSGCHSMPGMSDVAYVACCKANRHTEHQLSIVRSRVSTLATAIVDSKVSRKRAGRDTRICRGRRSKSAVLQSSMSDGVTSVIDAGSLHHFIRRTQKDSCMEEQRWTGDGDSKSLDKICLR